MGAGLMATNYRTWRDSWGSSWLFSWGSLRLPRLVSGSIAKGLRPGSKSMGKQPLLAYQASKQPTGSTEGSG